VRRNAVRIAKGSHGSAEPAVRAKHKAVSQDFLKAVDKGAFDDVRLWDNQTPFGEDMTLVFEMEDGVKTIHNRELWEQFLAKAAE